MPCPPECLQRISEHFIRCDQCFTGSFIPIPPSKYDEQAIPNSENGFERLKVLLPLLTKFF